MPKPGYKCVKMGHDWTVDELKKRIEALSLRHEAMKAANKQARRDGVPKPYSANDLNNTYQSRERYVRRLKEAIEIERWFMA